MAQTKASYDHHQNKQKRPKYVTECDIYLFSQLRINMYIYTDTHTYIMMKQGCTLTTIRLTFLIKALVGSTESMFACSMEFYWTGISPICTENKTQVFLLGLLVLANGKLTAAYQRSREGEGDRREKNRETQRPRREPKQT